MEEVITDRYESHPGEQASESRDALAKTLYSNLFDWLVAAINRKIPSYGAPCCL